MGANDFTTKDSGERAVFESGMQRDTQAGKPRFDLMFPLNVPYDEQMIVRLAALYGRGAEKYDERNWEQANSDAEMARMKASAFRHFMQWFLGETDEDHAAGAMFNIIAFETTEYKVDRAIDGLQPHELEAVDKIVEDVRAGRLDCTVTPVDLTTSFPPDVAGLALWDAVVEASAPEEQPDSLITATVEEWLTKRHLVIIGESLVAAVKVTEQFFSASVLPELNVRDMTSLEVARANGRPY